MFLSMEKFLKEIEPVLWTAFRWYLGAFLAFLAFIGLISIIGMIIS